MNPAEFARKWARSTRNERAAAHEHFINLCEMLGAPTPNDDPDGEFYAFEKGARKLGGEDGFADVWKRGSARSASLDPTCLPWRYLYLKCGASPCAQREHGALSRHVKQSAGRPSMGRTDVSDNLARQAPIIRM